MVSSGSELSGQSFKGTRVSRVNSGKITFKSVRGLKVVMLLGSPVRRYVAFI